MKFLVDAQLPLRLARLLAAAGQDVVHSSQLPDGNRTPDTVLASIAVADDRIVVTKDRDFEASHLVRREPARLLLVTTGNIANTKLLDLVSAMSGWSRARSRVLTSSRSRQRQTSSADPLAAGNGRFALRGRHIDVEAPAFAHPWRAGGSRGAVIEKDTDARRTTDEALDERTLAVLASHTAIGTYGVVVLAALLGIALLVAAAIP